MMCLDRGYEVFKNNPMSGLADNYADQVKK